MVKTE